MRLLILLLLLSLPGWAEKMEIHGFEFDSPVIFGPVEKLGLDAYSATYPAGKPYKEIGLELVVATYPAEGVKQMKDSGASPGEIARTSFLGVSGKAAEINKTLFFGKTAARRVYHSNIPRKNTVHVFSATLEDGSFVMVAVRDFGKTGKLGDLLSAIANSMTKQR